jgi:hypothetical protein
MRHGAFSLGREPISHAGVAATLQSERPDGGAIVR